MMLTKQFVPFSLSPALLLCCGIISGIMAGQALSILFAPFYAAVFTGIALWGLVQKKKFALFLGLGFLTGLASFLHHTTMPGLALCPPSGTISTILETGNKHWPYRLTITTNRFSFFLYTKQLKIAEYGDTIELKDLKIKAPKQSDFKRYLLKEGAAGTTFIQVFEPEVLKKAPAWKQWLHNKQEVLFKNIKAKCTFKTFGFFSSLFMGEKNRAKQLIEKTKVPFQQWGISHQLARSGLHLMIFVFVWYVLMSLLPCSYPYKTGILSLMSLIYFLFTPASVSFLRAFLLFGLYKFCNICNLQIHATHLIALVCSAVLLYNPFQLFFLDFQLSFFLTFCLAWLSHLNRQKRVTE